MKKVKYAGPGTHFLVNAPIFSEPYLFKASNDFTCTVSDKDALYMVAIYPGTMTIAAPVREVKKPIIYPPKQKIKKQIHRRKPAAAKPPAPITVVPEAANDGPDNQMEATGSP